MKRLRRVARGGSVAAFVCLAYACATGAEDGGLDGAGADGGTDGGRDVVVPAKDSGSTKETDAGGGGGGACDGKVVVNELMTRGATAGVEFVELYNPGGCAIPLGGWKLAYRSSTGAAGPVLHSFESGDEIAASSFLVLATSAFTGKKDVVMSSGMKDDGGQIALQDDQGKLVDAVGYGAASGAFVEGAPAPSPEHGGSIARKKDGVDTDDNGADFAKAKPHSAGVSNP